MHKAPKILQEFGSQSSVDLGRDSAQSCELTQTTLQAVINSGNVAAPCGVDSAQVAYMVRSAVAKLFLSGSKATLALILLSGGVGFGMTSLGIQFDPSKVTGEIIRIGQQQGEPRRDSQGDLLPPGAIARLGTTRFRHGGLIRGLEFSPDGKSIITSGAQVRQWDASNGKDLWQAGGETNVFCTAIAPKGNMLAILDFKPNQVGRIEIRDLATHQVLQRFGRAGRSIKFSTDGKLLAVFLDDSKSIELWDPFTGSQLRTLKGHEDRVYSVVFSPDNRTLLSGSDDRSIRVWNLQTGKEERKYTFPTEIHQIRLSPDGKTLAVIPQVKTRGEGFTTWIPSRTIQILDVESGRELRNLIMPKANLGNDFEGGFASMAFSPDGKVLATGGSDSILRVWDPATGQVLKQLENLGGTVTALDFALDSKRLAFVVGQSAVRIIDPSTGAEEVQTLGHWSSITSISCSPDGRKVFTFGAEGILRTWDLPSGRETQQRAIAKSGWYGSQVNPDGATYLAWHDDHQSLSVHDLKTGKQLRVLHGLDGSRNSFALSPDQSRLAQLAKDQKTSLVDTSSGQVLHILPAAGQAGSGMAFSPEGRELVIWDAARKVSIWDMSSGKKLREFPGPNMGGMPYVATLSPRGDKLAFGFQALNDRLEQRRLPIIDPTTGKEVSLFVAGEDGACELAFSPDGKLLAWAGWRDGAVHVGDIATGRDVALFVGHQGRISALAFSQDGKMLVSGCEDTTALVWDLSRKKLGRAGGD
jgi:WD40 repeat protein